MKPKSRPIHCYTKKILWGEGEGGGESGVSYIPYRLDTVELQVMIIKL